MPMASFARRSLHSANAGLVCGADDDGAARNEPMNGHAAGKATAAAGVSAGDRIERALARLDRTGPGWNLPAWILIGFLGARAVNAYMWYWGASTKHPWLDPPFGWLGSWLRVEVEHNPIPGYPWVVEHVLIPNIQLVGWTGFVVEAYLALVFTLGFVTRFHGWLAALWGLNIAIGNVGAPREPIWAILPLVVIPLLAGESRSGRMIGLDAGLRPRLLVSRNRWLRLLGRHGM